MEQIYLPLADFVRPNNLAGDQSLFLKMELDHLIRDRHVTGIFQEGIIFERNAYYAKFFMNCLKKLTKKHFNGGGSTLPVIKVFFRD